MMKTKIPPFRPMMLEHSDKRFKTKAKRQTRISSSDAYKIRDRCFRHHDLSLPEDFDWRLVSNNGKSRGKLATRIAKAVGKININQCSSSLRITVEDAIRSANEKNGGWYDWTFLIDWIKGDFGDYNTCYFPPGTYVDAMHRNGVGAIRHWKKDEIFAGSARAWMAVDQPFNQAITLYNAYGSSGCAGFAKNLSNILSDLELGYFDYKSTYISYVGEAYPNGDAYVMWSTDLCDEPDDRVVLQLRRNDI